MDFNYFSAAILGLWPPQWQTKPTGVSSGQANVDADAIVSHKDALGRLNRTKSIVLHRR
jgi:hypothetical protein